MELAWCGSGAWLWRRNQLINTGHSFQQLRVLLEVNFDVVNGITGTGDFVSGGVHVDHEPCRSDTNQDQHDQANAFLTVVCAVREGDTNSGKNQSDTRPEWRLFLAIFLFTFCGSQVNTGAFFGTAPVTTQDENQSTCNDQAHNRGNNQ
ncbi:hypothetical protein D3C75_151680 [compost metagenome]